MHALYAPGPDGRVERVQPRGNGERQPSPRARDFEERAGERSAERIAIHAGAPIIRRAESWRELHEGLATKKMRFEKKGSGALLWVGEQPVKASAAGRDCSMRALEKRLGEFEPAPLEPPRSPALPRPLEPSSRSYVQERHKHYEERRAERAHLADRQREEWSRLNDGHRRERTEIIRGAWTAERDVLNAMRSVVAARQAQEKAALRERQQFERATLRRDKGRFPAHEEWLGRDSRDRANEWRHRERRPPSIEGSAFVQPAPRDIRAFSAVVDGWKVHYHLTSARGALAFTDRGRTIDIHDARRRESVLAALQLGAQKWGEISVFGNELFKGTCVELAALHGFNITNPDLQQAIAAERLRHVEQAEPPRREDDRRSYLMTPAAIYGRHLAEIVRERARRQPVDPSRLDAEVAVRMAVTGHSREAIAQAIKGGAQERRRDERRDWNTYAQRAADFAFSPPGELLRAQLRDREQKFLRLEGRQDQNELLRRLGGPLKHL